MGPRAQRGEVGDQVGHVVRVVDAEGGQRGARADLHPDVGPVARRRTRSRRSRRPRRRPRRRPEVCPRIRSSAVTLVGSMTASSTHLLARVHVHALAGSPGPAQRVQHPGRRRRAAAPRTCTATPAGLRLDRDPGLAVDEGVHHARRDRASSAPRRAAARRRESSSSSRGCPRGAPEGRGPIGSRGRRGRGRTRGPPSSPAGRPDPRARPGRRAAGARRQGRRRWAPPCRRSRRDQQPRHCGRALTPRRAPARRPPPTRSRRLPRRASASRNVRAQRSTSWSTTLARASRPHPFAGLGRRHAWR